MMPDYYCSREGHPNRSTSRLILTRETSRIIEPKRTPGFWYIEVDCRGCGCRNQLPVMLYREEAEKLGCPVERSEKVPRELIAEYEERTGRRVVVLRMRFTKAQRRWRDAYLEDLSSTDYLAELAS